MSLRSILLLSHIAALMTAVSATISAPIDTGSPSSNVNKRNEWDDWPRCVTRPEGECTLYMATQKSEFSVQEDSRYRNFALFDFNCQLVSFQESEAVNPWMLLQGHLEEPIAVSISSDLEPHGYIYNNDNSWKLEEELECRDWDELDGVGCRMSFACT